MAYHLHYTAEFNNRQSQSVKIFIYRKDTTTDEVKELKVKLYGIEIGNNGNESKYDCIIGSRATITFYAAYNTTALDGETFLTDYYDEWKVEIICELTPIFDGFIEPSGGMFPFKDKPIDVTIACTDGLGLLKNIPLSQIDGDNFTGRNTLISYIAACLQKTGLELNIRTFCSLYEITFYNRTNGLEYDMFSQAKLDYRTFIEQSLAFTNCYEVLEKILQGFSLYYWKGMWVISFRGELQGTTGPTNYYVDYDFEGNVLSGNQDLGTQINIGSNQGVDPVNADQIVSYEFPAKSVKTEYRYEVPENLVNNQRLQELGAFISPISTPTHVAWQLVGWSQFHKYPAGINGPETAINNELTYIMQELNPFGFELDRYMVLPHDPASQNGPQIRNYIRNLNDDFFVEKGDKVTISVDLKLKNNQEDADLFFMNVYLLVVGGDPADPTDWRTLRDDGNWSGSISSLNYTAGRLNAVGQELDVSQWQTSGPQQTTIPISGNIYIALGTGGVDNGNEIHFKNLSIEHSSYNDRDRSNAIRGDYWTTTRIDNIQDKIEDQVYVSDSFRRIHKGAFFRTDGSSITEPRWYRYGHVEELHYKELMNLARYRHHYRRFKKITGSFRGALVASENAQGDIYPLCFHKHFKFVDDSNRLYVLVPPLRIDYVEGIFQGIFVEVYNSVDDESTFGDTHAFRYVF